jgi:excisionase family DNA binding protein
MTEPHRIGLMAGKTGAATSARSRTDCSHHTRNSKRGLQSPGNTLNKENEMFVTALEIAKILHCSKSKVYQLAKSGEIPSIHVGDLVRFDPDKVVAVMEAQDTSGPALVRRTAAPNR